LAVTLSLSLGRQETVNLPSVSDNTTCLELFTLMLALTKGMVLKVLTSP